MARRANSKIRPLWVALTVGALVLAIAVGVLLQSGGGDPYRTVPELDLSDYLNNANSLRGNTYKVRGEIRQSLGDSRAKGRLVSVEVARTTARNGNGGTDGGNGNGGGKDVLPVLVPPKLSYLNLQKGQRYTFELEVGDAGVLTAVDMKKS